MVLTDGRRYAKASAVDCELSRQRLERRYGERLTDYLATDRDPVPSRGSVPVLGSVGPVAGTLGRNPDLHPGRDQSSRGGGSVPGGAGTALRVLRGRDEPEEVRAMKAVAARGLHAAGRLVIRRQQLREEPGQPPGVGRKRTSRDQTSSPGKMTALRHRREAVRDPELVAIIKNVQAYERTKGKEMELAEAVRTNGELSGRLKEVPRMEAHIREQSRAFDEALAKVYHDPTAARQAFEHMAGREGTRAAFEMMRREPERFGSAREVVQRRWMGLKVEADKSTAHRAAQGAAHRGRDYLTAKERMPDATELARLRGVVERTEQRMHELKRQLAGQSRADALYKQLGERVTRLSENQIGKLRRALPSPRMGIIREAATKMLEVAKGRGR